MLCVSYFAGLLGALTGVGGAIIITPVLVLFFHVDIHYAMGASLISVIVVSSGAAIVYLKEGYTNIRIAMLLEVTAVIGAFVGALLVAKLPTNIIAIVFGIVMIFSAYFSVVRREDKIPPSTSHPWAKQFQLESSYPTKTGLKFYSVHRVPLALVFIGMAGVLSSLLGIGSGVLKVLAMDQAMQLPYKVSTATSNFMIGITAAVSAGVYWSLGYIEPVLVFPVMIGALVGAISGAKILKNMRTSLLRIIFGILIFGVALQMVYRGWSGVG